MQRDIRAGVELCRQQCQYFSVCGGGEPVNKLSENGTFVSTETTYCRLTRKRVTDLVLSALDRLPPSGSCASAPDDIADNLPDLVRGEGSTASRIEPWVGG
jgi:hypothetical protein